MSAGLRLGPVLAGRRAVVEEERLALTEELAAALLALDEPDEVVRILHQHVHLHPLRERAYGLLMKALCRLGDIAGALSAFAEARGVFVEQLGIEPGPDLRRLHRSILDGEPELDERPTAATARRTPHVKPAELRADLVGFVGRDAELSRPPRSIPPPSRRRPALLSVRFRLSNSYRFTVGQSPSFCLWRSGRQGSGAGRPALLPAVVRAGRPDRPGISSADSKGKLPAHGRSRLVE